MKKTTELLSNLEKYENKGCFHFRKDDNLKEVCNIPIRKDYSGLYIFYSQDREIVYVGISGREDSNGNVIHRKNGLRGRLLNGKQFGDRRNKNISYSNEIRQHFNFRNPLVCYIW